MKLISRCLPAMILIACSAYLSSLHALPDDKEQPINVSADSAQKNSNEGTTIYQGNVIITQGSIQINGDIITIFDSNGTVEKMVATGQPAKFKQTPEVGAADMIATGNSIEYDVSQETLLILENALLEQEGRTTNSNRITYDMNTTIVTAGDANGRVKMTLQPSK